MKHLNYILLLLAVLSCNRAQESSEIDKESITKEIILMLDNYHKDIAKDGLTAEFKYLDQSSDFFWVPPGYNTALSYDSVRSILEMNAKAFESIEFNWNTLEIFPLTNEIANYTGIVNGVMFDTAGVESKVSIIESGTLIKREDGWKLLSGQSAVLNLENQ